jgi:hypothetical protein
LELNFGVFGQKILEQPLTRGKKTQGIWMGDWEVLGGLILGIWGYNGFWEQMAK